MQRVAHLNLLFVFLRTWECITFFRNLLNMNSFIIVCTNYDFYIRNVIKLTYYMNLLCS